MTYNDIKDKILDNCYTDENGLTRKEIILANINDIAKDTANDIMEDVVDNRYDIGYGMEDYGDIQNFYDITGEEYTKNITDIITANIDQVVKDYNEIAQHFINIIGG